MAYKASKQFSFGGKVYVEGQEVDIADSDILEKFKDQGLVSSGKGKSAEDVQAEADEAFKKKQDEVTKARDEAAAAEEKRVRDAAGKPSVNAKMATEDQREKKEMTSNAKAK